MTGLLDGDETASPFWPQLKHTASWRLIQSASVALWAPPRLCATPQRGDSRAEGVVLAVFIARGEKVARAVNHAVFSDGMELRLSWRILIAGLEPNIGGSRWFGMLFASGRSLRLIGICRVEIPNLFRQGQ